MSHPLAVPFTGNEEDQSAIKQGGYREPPKLPEEVDGIFVGGGHNSLVAAAYLAKAGESVLVLEGADSIGGGVVTSELTLPLFRHNTHAFFVRWTNEYRIWQDLELDRFGVRSIFPPVQCALAYADGERALVLSNELGPSLESIRGASAHDAETYERMFPLWRDLVVGVLGPLDFVPPLPPEAQRQLLGGSELGRRYLDLSAGSALDVIRDWFESEPMRALAAFLCSIRGYFSVLDVPGTGHLPARALFTSRQARIIEGGSGEVLRAIASAVYEAGGRVASRSPVASIDVVDGRVRGVTTADGRRVRARRFVASSVPAPITLLELTGRGHLDPSLAEELERYRWRDEGLFGTHYALAAPPRLKAAAYDPGIERALSLALGFETSDVFDEHIAAVRSSGEPKRSALHASIPTVHDPTQAPPGLHTAFGWEDVPARDAAGRGMDWAHGGAERQAARMLETWERYAPGFGATVLDAQTHSPALTAQENPAMRFGDWHHGSYHPENSGHNRPHPSLAAYRTPVDGLYLCGSSQHPGGSFSGMPGFNVAGVIADDLEIEVWWQRPSIHALLGTLST